MEIATLGVGINPAKAVSGSATAVAAAERMADGMNKAGARAEKAEQGVGKGADEMARKVVDGSGKANRSANELANSNAWNKLRSTLASTASSIGHSFSGIGKAVLTLGAAFGALQAAMMPIMAAMAAMRSAWGMLSGAINKAADFEDYNIQFAQLLGGFDKAAERMKMLSDIAAKTPFNLPEIVRGTVTLESLTKGALTSRESIIMIGDAVAKSKLPFDEMSVTIGRLYANIKNGIPAAFELNRLIETGVITEGASQLREMAEKGNEGGKNAAKIWELVEANIRKASGSMALMSQTTNGLFSTLDDAWSEFQRTFGASLNEGLRPFLRAITQEIGGWTERAKQLAPHIEKAAIMAASLVNVLRQPGGFKLALDVAIQSAMDLLARGLEAAGKIFRALMQRAAWEFEKIMERMTDPAFWQGLADALYNAGVAFVGVIKQGISEIIGVMQSESFLMRYNPILSALKAGVTAASAINERTQATRTPNFVQANKGNAPAVPSFADAFAGTRAPLDVNKMMLNLNLAMQTAAIKQQNAQSRNPLLLSQGGGAAAEMANAMGSELGGEKGSKKGGGVDAAKKQASELEAAAKRVIDATRTPMEHFNNTMRELQTLQAKGLIDDKTYATAAAKAVEQYRDAVSRAADEMKRKLEAQMTPLQRLMAQWGDLKTNVENASVAMAGSLSANITDALTDMVNGSATAAEAFNRMALSIISDLVRMAIQMLVNWALQQALGIALGAVTGGVGYVAVAGASAATTAATHHTGGTVGDNPRDRTVPASTFKNAPRYQHGGGVTSGETPIIAEQGETVLTRQQSTDIKRRLGQQREESQPTQISIVNVVDPKMVEQALAKDHRVIMNIIQQNARTVKQMLA